MLRYTSSSTSPHVYVEASGMVTASEVRSALSPLPDDLDAMPTDFVVLAEYPDLILIKDDAVGPLFYYVARLFDAEPSLAVFVTGGERKHPGLRQFIETLGRDHEIQIVDTMKEARRIIGDGS